MRYSLCLTKLMQQNLGASFGQRFFAANDALPNSPLTKSSHLEKDTSYGIKKQDWHTAYGTADRANRLRQRAVKVGLQMPEQPDHLDIAVGLGFQAAARASTVQIAVDVELQQVRRSITRTARRLRNRADKPKRREVQSVDKRLDEPHRVVGRDVIVNRLR